MITAEDVTFEYPGVRALDGVSFHTEPGSITALVGPNGAGKTTLLRCLAGLERPLAGRIVIGGVDVLEHPRASHRRMGYLSDFFGLYERLRVRQALSYVAAANRVASEAIAPAVTEVAERLGVSELLDTPGGELSRGQRQRVAIAQAVIHAPEVLILDEPASGLDPEARHDLAALFVDLRDRGMTLIVSSHILAELEAYSTDMLVLREGRLVEHSPLAGPSEAPAPLALTLAAEHGDAERLLAGAEGVAGVTRDGLTLRFEFTGDSGARHRLLAELIGHGVPVCALAEQPRNLQASYLATVRGERAHEA